MAEAEVSFGVGSWPVCGFRGRRKSCLARELGIANTPISIALSKICVFCGSMPEGRARSREHVLPKWLLAMTGDPNRRTHLVGGSRPFSTYHFNACIACNRAAGEELEAEARRTMEALLSRQSVSANQIDGILDWFDKVRVGLWLASLVGQSHTFKVSPRYFINDRLRTQDRLLVVYQARPYVRGLTFIGSHTPEFQLMPSVFGLKVNDLCFLNVSSVFCLAKSIGFPYPKFVIPQEGTTRELYGMNSGFEFVSKQGIELPLHDGGSALFQLSLPEPKDDPDMLYRGGYVQQYRNRSRPGMTVPLQMIDNCVSLYPEAASTDWVPSLAQGNDRLIDCLQIAVLGLQRYMYQSLALQPTTTYHA